MHLYLPHISVVLVLITLAAFILEGGGLASFRTSRAINTMAVIWIFWLLYLLTEHFIH